MSAETLIQIAVVRMDIALVAAWHILRIALPVMMTMGVAVIGVRSLRRRR